MSETTLSAKPQTSEAVTADLTTNRTRILLVEGDGFTRIVLLLRLRLAGFSVDFTSNGILGLRKVRSCQPDVLLLDLKLNGLSGLELIKAARAEPGFGKRPIYVFTYAERMSRATRKEVGLLDITLVDKGAVSREQLVQTFASTFLDQASPELGAAGAPGHGRPNPSGEMLSPEELEEIIAGVREQSELLTAARDQKARAAKGPELLSRVCSLASCADAAGLKDLTRHARALEKFLEQLCRSKHGYSDAALKTVTRAIEVMSRMASSTPGSGQDLSRFSALIADEAAESGHALQNVLREFGFAPVECQDPAGAREYLTAHKTDLVIVNVLLPEAHGLAVRDIRRLPLHARTPIVFGPESSVAALFGRQLPTSAPRLDDEPLSLAELVVKALNEVQSGPSPTPSHAEPAPPVSGVVRGPANALAATAFDDGFNLFGQPAKIRPEPPAQPVAPERLPEGNTVPQGTAGSTPARAERTKLFNELFDAAGIPSEPFSRAEPGPHSEDPQAETLAPLPATPTDGAQTDDRPLEALPTSDQAEAPQPPQCEANPQDRTAASSWVAAAVQEDGESSAQVSAAPELQRSNAAQAQELTAGIPKYEEIMSNQVQAAPAEYDQQGQISREHEQTNEPENQLDTLATRVCEAEMALYHARAQLEKKQEEIEALHRELAAAQAASANGASPAEQQAQARCAELEQELASLRQVVEDFNGSFDQSKQGAAEADKAVQALHERLNHTEAELEQQKAEQQRSDGELRQQLESAKAAGEQSETAREQAESRCAQLEQELNGLREAREELAGKLAKAQESQALPGRLPAQTEPVPGGPSSDVEQQVRQGVAALARATAELAKERGERQRGEQRMAELSGRMQALHEDLGRTLQVQREHLARITALEEEQRQSSELLERRAAELEQQQAELCLAEDELQKTKELNAQLRKDLSFFEEASKKFESARQELQSKLETTLATARETEARFQQEAAERQRLNQALDSVQRNLRDNSDRDFEVSKLETALQVEQLERQRQGTQLTRLRQSALGSAHAARALRASLRRQIREPVDNLVHSTRRLLELEMGEEQKSLAEAVLQDVLLVQTRLREPEPAKIETAEPGVPPPTTPT